MSQHTSPPKSLYKYLSPKRAAKFFERPALRFTPAAELNDIFELNPHIEEFFLIKKFLQEFGEYYDASLLNRANNLGKFLQTETGVLSLSSIPDSLLMWAHYCEKHEGFVVELDTESQFFKPEPDMQHLFWDLEKTTYSKDRPSISILKTVESKPKEMWSLFFLPVFFAKSEDWSYEEEWRFIAPHISKLDPTTGDDGCALSGLILLPVSAIKSVILGARTNQSHFKQALAFSRKHKIPTRRAVPDAHRFALNIIDINDSFQDCVGPDGLP